MTFFYLFFLTFFFNFLFYVLGGERHKRGAKNIYLPLFLTEVDYGVLTKRSLGGQSDTFQTTGR